MNESHIHTRLSMDAALLGGQPGPEIGMSIPWGKWCFEFTAGARLFTDNDDFVADATLEQDPLYNLQLHWVYGLTPRQWVSLNANYFFGGVTYLKRH
jgi:hypothetical protein